MKRRETACQDATFVQHLQQLGKWIQASMHTTAETDQPAEHGRLRLCRPTELVACTVCGVYFTCMRTMKTHRTQMHEAPTTAIRYPLHYECQSC